MLLELSVENLAIIDQATLTLEPGMTALTGETGAGKSLVIDAIGLALGGRADSEIVRAGAAKAVVTLRVHVPSDAATVAQRLGVDLYDGELIIHREVMAKGGSTARLNGRAQAIGVLREIGAVLVDLHGQHDHQALLNPERQIEFLDSWIGPELIPLKEACAEKFGRWEEAKRRLSQLRSSMREREQRIDLLRYQIDEIESAQIQPNELADQEALLVRMRNSERLGQAAMAALDSLQDAEESALDRLGAAVHSLRSGAAFDPEMAQLLEPFEAALGQIEDGARALRRYSEGLDFEPAMLEDTAARVDLLKKLRRKYGDSEVEILLVAESARQELAMLEDAEASEEAAAKLVESTYDDLRRACDRLTARRAPKAKEFGAQTLGEIRDLAMEKAEFSLQMAVAAPGPEGQDVIEFLFSANPGEPLLPLAKVASGGELSRVMLAIKAASAGRAGVPTLIFDEVDTGLSGRAAAVMARKLQELARHRQVIVISHLPQIAAKADGQWRIEKVEEGGRSVTRLRRLDEAGRVEELARMLAGEEIGEMAIANARELLAR